jgi:hypothetical protein
MIDSSLVQRDGMGNNAGAIYLFPSKLWRTGPSIL